jgi:hypothetical protein
MFSDEDISDTTEINMIPRSLDIVDAEIISEVIGIPKVIENTLAVDEVSKEIETDSLKIAKQPNVEDGFSHTPLTEKLNNSRLKSLGFNSSILSILSIFLAKTSGYNNLLQKPIPEGSSIDPIIKRLPSGKIIVDLYSSLSLYRLSLLGKSKYHWYFHYLLKNGTSKTVLVKCGSGSTFVNSTEALKYVITHLIDLNS